MKPKNLIYCRAIRRSKMLFDTESKANNFLNFNSEEILEETGKAPVRSYYCTLCGGWHVTSNPSKEIGEQIDTELQNKIERIISLRKEAKKKTAVKKDTPEEESIKNRIMKRLEDFYVLLVSGRFNDAEDTLDNCKFDLDDLDLLFCRHDKADKQIKKALGLLQIYKDMQKLSDKSKLAMSKLIMPNKIQREAICAIRNMKLAEELNSVLENKASLIACADETIVTDILNSCKSKIETLSGTGSSETQKYYTEQLSQIRESRRRTSVNTPKKTITAPEVEPEEPFQDIKEPRNEYEAEDLLEPLPSNYAQELMSLIDRVMNIRNLYNEGNYSECQSEIEICHLILDQIGISTKETSLIQSQLDEFDSFLNKYLDGKATDNETQSTTSNN